MSGTDEATEDLVVVPVDALDVPVLNDSVPLELFDSGVAKDPDGEPGVVPLNTVSDAEEL